MHINVEVHNLSKLEDFNRKPFKDAGQVVDNKLCKV